MTVTDFLLDLQDPHTQTAEKNVFLEACGVHRLKFLKLAAKRRAGKTTFAKRAIIREVHQIFANYDAIGVPHFANRPHIVCVSLNRQLSNEIGTSIRNTFWDLGFAVQNHNYGSRFEVFDPINENREVRLNFSAENEFLPGTVSPGFPPTNMLVTDECNHCEFQSPGWFKFDCYHELHVGTYPSITEAISPSHDSISMNLTREDMNQPHGLWSWGVNSFRWVYGIEGTSGLDMQIGRSDFPLRFLDVSDESD